MVKNFLGEIYKVIDLAKERDAVPSSINKDEKVSQVISLSEVDANPIYCKLNEILQNYLRSLEYDVLEALQIIMWIGRGDYVNDNLRGEELYIKAKEEFGDISYKDKKSIVDYITSKSQLGKYLEKGISIIKE